MLDFAQDVFDAGEAIAQHLDHAAGCDDALERLLDEAMAGAPVAVQRAVNAVLEAQRQFRATASRETERLTRAAAVH